MTHTQPLEPALWPRWAMATIAAIAVGFAALTPFVHTEGDRWPWLVVLLAAAVSPWLLGTAGVRLRPSLFAAGVIVPVAVINLGARAIGLAPEHDAQLSLMLLVLLGTHLGAVALPRIAVPAGVVAALIPPGRFLVEGAFGNSWVFWSTGIVLGMLAGAIGGRQQRLVLELQHAQAALSADAARQERQRIAREVHDVIAHSLTVTMLHLTTARIALRRDLTKAEDTLTEAERLGRRALADVRRAVGLLHDGDGDTTAPALPGIEELPSLIDSYRAAGVALEVEVATDTERLSPASSLAVYRTVQESLANAAKHAPGAPVAVEVRDEDGDVLVRVRDDGGAPTTRATGAGLGLRAMDERVRALGGSVTAGPRGQGWSVDCRIPAEPTP
ncbi:sensor histidine kinase [Nitriliruptor alkaliphilus]|uniref:sensor histidine kinase n=1 Tax=Nitriliruptor alkaliphilus TaxID=427918 RepID=UPI0006970BBD|nr:sensor histidine kinase [Nitriliruptor alkaliphilus]